MNREDIIRMAQKAGFVWLGEYHSNLEDFAALVASAERERIKQANAPEIERINAHIKEALAQPEQEPVAWGVFEGNLHDMFFSPSEAQEMADLKGTHAEVRPLYTTPPQRTWVGLTDEEISALAWNFKVDSQVIRLVELEIMERNL